MKKGKKRIFSLFISIVLIFSMMCSTFAVDTNISLNRQEEKVEEKVKEEKKEDNKEKVEEKVKEEKKEDNKEKAEEKVKEEKKEDNKEKAEEKVKEEKKEDNKEKVEEKVKEEKKEVVTEDKIIEKKVEPLQQVQPLQVQEEKPLELVKTIPQQTQSGLDEDAEIALIFNRPVELNPDEKESCFVDVMYDEDNKHNPSDMYPNASVFSHKLEFSKETPEKVIIKLCDENGNPINLKKNHMYSVSIYPWIIKAQKSNKVYADSIEIRFDTIKNAIPKSARIDKAPTKVSIDKTKKINCIVEDAADKEIDCKINWKTSNENIAKINENGEITGKSPGQVKVTATVDGTNISTCCYIEIRGNYSKQLTEKWAYTNINANNYKGYPVLSSNNSVYSVLENKGLEILALNPDGTEKENFKKVNISNFISIGKIKDKEYIFGANKDDLLVLNPEGGDIDWKTNLESSIVTTPIVNKHKNIIVGCENSRVYAVNGETKQIVWKFDTEKSIFRDDEPPTINSDGNIYIVSGDTLFYIDGINGKLIWKFENPNVTEDFKSQASIGDNVVYIKDKKSIYAITNEYGNVRWSKDFGMSDNGRGIKTVPNVGIMKPIVEPDGVCFCVKKEDKGDVRERLYKFSKEKGDIIGEYPYETFFGIGTNQNFYTDKVIYDIKRYPIANYDDNKYNLSYLRYSNFSLGKDGIIYRIVMGGYESDYKVRAIEAISLYDISNSKPCDIKLLKENLDMYSNSKYILNPQVVDQNNVVLPSVEVEYKSENEDIVRVSKDGEIQTLNKKGMVNITVTVVGTSIRKSIKINVKEMPKPTKISLVRYKGANTNINDEEVIGEKITSYVDQQVGRLRVFVQDDQGNFIPSQKLKWEIEGDSGILETYYEHGEGLNEKYGVQITGRKTGKVVVKVSLVDYPNISCKVEIEVEATPYSVKWAVPIEGAWHEMLGYHTMSKEKIFYINGQKVTALNKNGEQLWQSKVGINYGVDIKKLTLGKDGYVYVYSNDRTAVFKLNPDSGEVVWKIIKENDPIKDVKTTQSLIYALTNKGKLYTISKDGEIIGEKTYDSNSAMIISNDDKLYISSKSSVYEVSQDKDKEIYKSEVGNSSLEDITNENNLIIQKGENGKYSLLSVNVNGKKNWEYNNLNEKVLLSSDKEGNVYAVDYTEKKDRKMYILNKDGKEKKTTTIHDYPTTNGVYKPIIGDDGYLYVSIINTHKIDPNTGEEKYYSQFKGSSNKTSYPSSLTIDPDGTMYMVAGEKGVMAVKGKVITSDKFQIDVQGLTNIKLDTLKDIKIDLTNSSNDEKEKDIRFNLTLSKKMNDNNESIMTTDFKDKIKTGTKIYNCSIKIPNKGKYELKINIYNIENEKETLIHEFSQEIEL